MLPLIRMAWTLNRCLLLQAAPLFVLYLAVLILAQRGSDPVKFITVALAIACLCTAIVTLQGLTLPVEGFLLSLPVSRPQVVRAKYATSLAGLAAGLALPLVTGWSAHLVAPARVPALASEAVGLVALGGVFLALGIFLLLPFIYRLGPSKGLMAFTLTLIVLPAGALAWKGTNGCMDVLEAFGMRWLAHRPFALTVCAGLLLLGLASLSLSIRSYRRRAI